MSPICFAGLLPGGNKKVCDTARDILASMKRDWITVQYCLPIFYFDLVWALGLIGDLKS